MIVRENFPFKNISWFKVGGIVSKFIIADTIEELKSVLTECKKEKIITVGNVSNILMSDSGFNGIILKLGKDFMQKIVENDDSIKCGSACTSLSISEFALKNCLSGLEFLYTVPGCIGGNVFMNAGCYGSEIKDILESIEVFDKKSSSIVKINRNNINFTYRSSNLSDNFIVLNTTFKCQKEDENRIKNKMNFMYENRLKSQPIAVKTCGSTFKNPDGLNAWRLLDEVGLRGFKIGGAKFSEKHPNFIINEGLATSNDIYDLINLGRKMVLKEKNIRLETEIVIIGEFGK